MCNNYSFIKIYVVLRWFESWEFIYFNILIQLHPNFMLIMKMKSCRASYRSLASAQQLHLGNRILPYREWPILKYWLNKFWIKVSNSRFIIFLINQNLELIYMEEPGRPPLLLSVDASETEPRIHVNYFILVAIPLLFILTKFLSQSSKWVSKAQCQGQVN